MPLPVSRLRRWFAAGAILMVVVVAGMYLYARWRVRNALHDIPKKIGVDINRNYDFMWDFKKFFHRAAWTDSLASDNPAIETFHGPEPFSEPETRNVRWLMDRFNPV